MKNIRQLKEEIAFQVEELNLHLEKLNENTFLEALPLFMSYKKQIDERQAEVAHQEEILKANRIYPYDIPRTRP